jgi:hypothetical protein
MKKLQRAHVHVRVGKMFKLTRQAESGARSASKGRQDAVAQGTRQIMLALADLLPEKYQGAYSDTESQPPLTLKS